jgi:hypothetical protein
MIATVNVAYTVPILILDSLGAGKTGLTVTASARLAGSATTASATVTERTGGQYDVAFTPSAVGQWIVTATATVDGDPFTDVELVQAVTAAQFDPVSALAVGIVSVVSPVAPISGNVTVYQGDDQKAVDSRSLDWATSSAGQWPDLTGASIALAGEHRTNGALTVAVSGSVVTPTGASKQVRVELTHGQTAALRDGVYDIQMIATLASGDVVTLVDAAMTVLPRRG